MDYIGRIRGNQYYRLQNSVTGAPITSLHKAATATPALLGGIDLCKEHGLKTTLLDELIEAFNNKSR